MSIVLLSLRAIIPVFGIIAIGYFIRCIKLMKENDAKNLNLLCFNVFLPALCFNSTYNNSGEMGEYTRLIIFITVTFCVLTILVFLIIPKFEPNRCRKGVDVQGIYRSNALLMGLPIVVNLYGEAGALPAVLTIGIILPLQNLFAVEAMTRFVSDDTSGAGHIWKTLTGICKNPLLIAIILGMVLSGCDIVLPSLLLDIIADFSEVATTLALTSLGATFTFTNVTNNIGHIFWISVGKLIVYPSISIVLAIMLGFTGVEIATIIAVFATPCGVSGYTMAAATDNDGELAGQLVVITSVAAIFTMTAIFSICQVGGWI